MSTVPVSFSRFAPKRGNGKGRLKIIPIEGVGNGKARVKEWLSPQMDHVPVALFQEMGAGLGSGPWVVLTPSGRHGPFTDLDTAVACWSIEGRKA
jgi:hypothetical protein